MHVIAWRYRVKPDRVEEFKKAYGSDGSWVRLFQSGEGYVKTDLLPSKTDPFEFTTVDYWTSQEAFDNFKAAHREEYEKLDADFARLTIREERIRRAQAISRRTLVLREFRNAALILLGIASAAMGLKG